MIDPNTFYVENVNTYSAEISALKRRLYVLSTIRLAVFLLFAFSIYYVLPNWQYAILIGVVGGLAFLFTVSKFTDHKVQLALKKALYDLNLEEQKIAKGNFDHRAAGETFKNSNHAYSFDLDLFGQGSFFQYLNRTTLEAGTLELVDHLTSNNHQDILLRQSAIRELSENPDWMQHYIATGSLIKTETSVKSVNEWLDTHQNILPSYMKWIPLAFTVGSLLLIILSVSNLIDPIFLGYWLLLGLGITGLFLKKINLLSHNCDKIKTIFKQYASLLDQIEQVSFSSDLLVEKQQKIISKDEKASKTISKFSGYLNDLDNRNNLFGAILGNGFFLSDIKNTARIEKWISINSSKVKTWFEVVAFFDAYNSLGTFAFNHQQFTYPKIVTGKQTIEATDLGHPMISKNKRITSNVTIDEEQFLIVTGANMAGKSTFLRTVSIYIVMANLGLPVCANSSNYRPVKLITSMRTSDSLSDESSYFFSELKRLKYIIEAIEQEPHFIILDEILKGTNSTDKAIGSKKFIEKLVSGNATGIIATHDLSLCDIASELDQVKNYYFATEIVDNELYFDYKLKQGVCQNMNASFLLNKMNII